MSKFAALAAVLALAAVVPTAAAYDLPLGVSYDLPEELLAFIAATPPDKDFAVGSGKFSKTQHGVAEQFNFSAHGTLAEARGKIRINSATFGETQGEVTCLLVESVNGVGRAGIAGRFPPDEPLGGQFTHFILAVADNGEPKDVPQDAALFVPSNADLGQPDCGLSFLESFGSVPIEQGNIVVKDR